MIKDYLCVTGTNDIVFFPDGRLDAKNAAKYMGLSMGALATMRCNGKGPRFIKRGHIFYYKDDIDAWFKEAPKFVSTSESSGVENKLTCLK